MGISPLLEGYFPEGSFVWLTFCHSVSYATAFRDKLRPTELRLTLNELRDTLKNIMPPAHRSFAASYGKINDM
jgi:hypothetical protein